MCSIITEAGKKRKGAARDKYMKQNKITHYLLINVIEEG